MNVKVTGRHIDVGDALRGHVADEVEAIVSKYFDQGLDSSVVFGKRGAFFECEVAVHVERRARLRVRARLVKAAASGHRPATDGAWRARASTGQSARQSGPK